MEQVILLMFEFPGCLFTVILILFEISVFFYCCYFYLLDDISQYSDQLKMEFGFDRKVAESPLYGKTQD